MQSAIRRYFAFQMLTTGMFFGPILVIFWQANGMSVGQMLNLQAFYSICAMVFEIPTGIYADVIGKRRCLTIGAMLFGTGLLWYSTSTHIWQFAIGELICAMGSAFCSGADRAYLHELLTSRGTQHEYKKVEGLVRGGSALAGALVSVAGGIIGSISLALTFTFSSASMFLAAVCSAGIRHQIKSRKSRIRDLWSEYLAGIRITILDSRVLWLTVYFGIFNALVFASTWFPQLYFQTLHIPMQYFGLIFAGFQLCVAFIAPSIDRLDRVLGSRTFIVLGTVAVASIALLSTRPQMILIPLFGVLTALPTVNQTVVNAQALRIVPHETAATILSVQSLMRRIIYALFLPLLGAVSDNFGMSRALLFNALMIASVLLVLYLVRRIFVPLWSESS